MIASFVFALLFGALAVFLVRGYLNSAHVVATSQPRTVPVVVAAQPIAHGDTLVPAMLRVAAYPQDIAPVGAFQTIAQITAASHTALHPIGLNEPVLALALSGLGAKAHLSSDLRPGMRAVSFRATDVAGVGGFALPGDHVDVLATRSIGGGEGAVTVTQSLAENALVLGVDQMADQTKDTPVVAKAITIEVTPDQAQAISLAQSVGTVTLSLRQVADDAPLVRKATTAAELGAFGYRPPAVAGAPGAAVAKGPMIPRGGIQVHVIRGIESAGYGVAMF